MYNVQCLSGHVYEAPIGSELEKRCIKHEKDGFLDALILSPEECGGCIEEAFEAEMVSRRLDRDFPPEP